MFLLGVYGVKYQYLAIACSWENKFSLPYYFICCRCIILDVKQEEGGLLLVKSSVPHDGAKNGASCPVFRFTPQFAPLVLLLLLLFRFFLLLLFSTIVHHHQHNLTSLWFSESFQVLMIKMVL